MFKVQSSMFKSQPPRRCACGCGTILRAYNGQRRLACYAVWREIPAIVRSKIMLPGSSLAERRAAARFVFEEAIKIRRARELGVAE